MPKIGLFNPFAPATAAASVSVRETSLEGLPLAYRLLRARRRTIAIHVGTEGVEVRAPHRAALAEIEGFVQRKARWILRRLADARPVAPFHWEEGSRLPILGNDVRLAAAPGLQGIAHDGATLLIGDAPRPRASRRGIAALARNTTHTLNTADATQKTADDWRTRVIAWLREQALVHYAGRAAEFATALTVPMPTLKLSNASTQWGSCIRRGHAGGARVMLHWKLYLLPPRLIDYVVAHELAHLRELNHSPRFWAEVARVYPDPLAARRELRVRGRALPQL